MALKGGIKKLAYEYEEHNKNVIGTETVFTGEESEKQARLIELQNVYRKAQAFDNYMVDLVKSMETYPHEYEKYANFLKETYEFYMQDKEDFIKGYKDEVRRGYELISNIDEYDKIIKGLEANNE